MTSKRPSADIRRAQLLDAADAVFSEHGVTAPLDLVVERAEVGRATLYRQFPGPSGMNGLKLPAVGTTFSTSGLVLVTSNL